MDITSQIFRIFHQILANKSSILYGLTQTTSQIILTVFISQITPLIIHNHKHLIKY